MMTLLSFLFLGFFLGMRHAADADHVVAVTTIVSRERSVRNAALIGVIWGIGHTLTLLLVGGAIILLGIVIPSRVGLSLEFSVALMLILLGLLNFKSFMHSIGQPPAETGIYANHLHEHGIGCATAERIDQRLGRLGLYQSVRPLVVGVVHGLAGSAAVALLVLPLIQNSLWALSYLLIFGAGTIGGMMLITAAIALPFACAATRSAAFHRRLGFASGFLSMGFGIFLVYQIGFVQGLFTK